MNETLLPWLIAGAVLPSLLISWIACFAVRRWGPQWGLVDQPGHRKVHATPTPLGGGVAIWLGVIGVFAAGQLAAWRLVENPSLQSKAPAWLTAHLPGVVQSTGELWLLLGAGTLLAAVGLIDDLRGLDWRLRIAVQFIVAAVCVAWPGWRLTAYIVVPAVTWLLSILWIVGLINAFNMLDNMDGLSGGVAAIASSVLAAVVLLTPDPETGDPQWFIAGLLLVLTGAVLGFLWHNRPPARLFMGDAGSYFLGFMLAIATLLATYAGYQSDRRHAVLAPICVMAVPLYDMITVIVIRLRAGHSPFHADKNHFSHRLVDLGLSKTQAVLTVYLLTATCGLGALLLHQVDALGGAMIVLMVLCVLALIAILETSARRKLKA